MNSAVLLFAKRFLALESEPSNETHQVGSQRQNFRLGHVEPAGDEAARIQSEVLEIEPLGRNSRRPISEIVMPSFSHSTMRTRYGGYIRPIGPSFCR